jgi:glutamyl-tRNA reductase
MTKQRRQRPRLIKSETKKGDITTNNNGIQRIIREYFENLYSNKLENLDEVDKFLDAYNQPKLNQEDINHLKRSITSNGIEAVMKGLPKEGPRNQEIHD